MNRIVRSLLIVIWASAGLLGAAFAGMWWDRARDRKETPDLSGWGLLFIAGAIVLLIGVLYAYRLANRNRNGAAVIVSFIDAVILTLGIVFVAPEIGWASSLRLLAGIVGVLIYIGIHIVLALAGRYTLRRNS